MPTYGYRCSACGSEFERFQKMSDPPVTDCECGAQGTVKKKLFPVGIAFKGTGFYVNDYAKSGGSSPAKTESAEAKTESKTETKSETASAPATDSAKPAATPTTTTTTT